MTEYEKMLNNLPYDYTDAEIQSRIKQTYYAMRDFNQCGACHYFTASLLLH